MMVSVEMIFCFILRFKLLIDVSQVQIKHNSADPQTTDVKMVVFQCL
jgi:hypothetical protein